MSHKYTLFGLFLVPVFIASCLLSGLVLQHTTTTTYASTRARLPFRSYAEFVRFTAAHHRAPFLSTQAYTPEQYRAYVQQLGRGRTPSSVANGRNIRVNRDQNPWSKVSVAAAVDPNNGRNIVVATNDYRQNYSHIYYHVSQSGGKTWSDDTLSQGVDSAISAPYNQQTNPGVAFDLEGHSYISSISSNVLSDYATNYANFDTQIDVAQGYHYGTYTSYTPTLVDYAPCNGILSAVGSFNCPGQLQRPLITVDTNASSTHKDTIYVYYTYFCNGISVASGGGGTATPQPLLPCVDGSVTIPPLSSVILEADAPGAGLPFSKPRIVSDVSLTQTAFANMVIDSHGTPHMFYENYATYPTVELYEATLQNDSWQTRSTPLVSFQFNSLSNTGWNFYGNSTPGCSMHVDTVYCAFSANQVNGGATYATPSVYTVSRDTSSDSSPVQVTRVNNDAPGDLKDHFFPWVTTNSHGDVYVGWYDNRNDPFNTKVQYYVAKSSDGGKSFPRQQPVNDVPFNPCSSNTYCTYFGDYYQLITGRDDVVHATWSDTRDGSSSQLYTQAITW